MFKIGCSKENVTFFSHSVAVVFLHIALAVISIFLCKLSEIKLTQILLHTFDTFTKDVLYKLY